jgi:transposase
MKTKSMQEQRGNARVQLPQRHQAEIFGRSLDQLIRDDHLVRTVVGYCESLDLSELYAPIKATRENLGRTPIDPRILFELWLFATLEGENSGRRIDELCKRDLAYMWICGEVSVNYHTICDFRTQHSALLERILTDSIALLHLNGLVKLETIAHDGMRVRANAGSGSFRRQGSLEESRASAEAFLSQLDDDDDNDDQRRGQDAARKRAARERLDRLEAACLEMEEMQQRYAKRNKGLSDKHKRSQPRASTTDPQARRMKMGDNGFRPAMNVQFANDADALVIVKVDVNSEGSDAALLAPMYDKVCQDYGRPKKYLADGGFSKKDGVTHLEREGTQFYGKLHNEQKLLDSGEDPYAAKPRENEHFTAFRQRMGTEEAQAIYRRRAPAAEFPNAVCRNQGLTQFSVRGLAKAKAQVLWHALSYNFRRFMNLIDEKTGSNYLEVLMES